MERTPRVVTAGVAWACGEHAQATHPQLKGEWSRVPTCCKRYAREVSGGIRSWRSRESPLMPATESRGIRSNPGIGRGQRE